MIAKKRNVYFITSEDSIGGRLKSFNEDLDQVLEDKEDAWVVFLDAKLAIPEDVFFDFKLR